MSSIPNPDTAFHVYDAGVIGWPYEFGGILYWAYKNKSGETQPARFDGSRLSLIPNPDKSRTACGMYMSPVVVFRNDLYLLYLDSTSTFRLAKLVYPATDIEEINSENLRIYPNPASDIITIELPGIVTNHDLSLYSVTGVLMIRKRINGDYEQLDMGGIPPGVYILKIKGKEISIARKIIKI